MKTLWLTDLHLDFPDAPGLERFYLKLEKAAADAVLISGDISQAPTVIEHLRQLQNAAHCPVYFVLGNHDYYYGSIAAVRTQAARVFAAGPIRYVSLAGVIPLTDTFCCIGHDGWGDGRNGDFLGSSVRLNDFELISELAGLPKLMLQKNSCSLATRLPHICEWYYPTRLRLIIISLC